MRYDIRDYGAVPDGTTMCTEAIQRAIDDCNRTGGTVVVPTGSFMAGSLRLLSNVELHLEKGARLISSIDQKDMIDFAREFKDDNKDTGWEGGCFLFAAHEENITISGEGVIDGQGRLTYYDDDEEGDPHESPLNVRGFRPRMSFLEDIKGLTVKDVTFEDSAYWTLHMAGCRDVLIENIRIYNNDRGPNNDGIDPDCCRNVIIKGCIIRGGDDSIVVKSTAPMYEKYGGCENIIIQNCILTSRSSALKIGTETYGDIHHICLSDCVLKDCQRGVGIWSRDGGDIHDIVIHHIMGNTRRFAECSKRRDGVYLWWGKGEPIFISATKREGVDRLPGRIYDIHMDHINLTSEGPIIIAGEEYSRISDVSITDADILYKKQSGMYPDIIDEMPSVRGRVKRDIPCVYLRCADNTVVEGDLNVDVSLKDHIRVREIIEQG